jgi:hypothetical protein
MNSAEFETQLRQSVSDHVALVHAAAKAAKARIGAAIAERMTPQPAFVPAPEPSRRPDVTRPAVDFFAAEEPAAAAAADFERPVRDAPIAFDDFGSNVDDEGIPVWEDSL